jgi:hypothetical protein
MVQGATRSSPRHNAPALPVQNNGSACETTRNDASTTPTTRALGKLSGATFPSSAFYRGAPKPPAASRYEYSRGDPTCRAEGSGRWRPRYSIVPAGLLVLVRTCSPIVDEERIGHRPIPPVFIGGHTPPAGPSLRRCCCGVLFSAPPLASQGRGLAEAGSSGSFSEA